MEDAIKLAKALVHEHGVKEKVCSILADACRLPFRDKVFDEVVSIGVFEHVPKVEDEIKEGWRVLKNIGVLFLMTPNRLFPYDFYDTNLPFIIGYCIGLQPH
ncbi:MAG: class I SAM-dependent methyltransferase [Candidatus Baldrarchaeia archaeon]